MRAGGAGPVLSGDGEAWARWRGSPGSASGRTQRIPKQAFWPSGRGQSSPTGSQESQIVLGIWGEEVGSSARLRQGFGALFFGASPREV